MPGPDDSSSLERLRNRLYTPQPDNATGNAFGTSSFVTHGKHLSEAETEWQQPTVAYTRSERPISWTAIFLIVTLIFFLAAVAVAGFIIFFGSRAVSINNVIVTAQGPTTIASGDTVPLLIEVKNQNPVAMTGATIMVDFPDGTKSADGTGQPLMHYRDTLGDIAPGASVTRTVSGVLFGSENQPVKIPITIEYETKGSDAVFVKDKEYDLTITSSPLSVNVTALSEVASGQPITLSVEIRSNATTPIDNVAVAAEYPFGFAPTNATPAPSSGSLFMLGTLAPGDVKDITIHGILSGQENDARAFHFTAGTVKDSGALALDLPYTSKEADIVITKPFLSATLALNGDTSDTPVIHTGMPVAALLSWANALTSPIANGQISIKLTGNALDTNSITTPNGFYSSSDTTVLYSKSTTPGLGNLAPGDTGGGSFQFSTKSGSALVGVSNPTVTFSISVAGQRLNESNVPEAVSSTITRTAKVATDVALGSNAVHSAGPITNSGPWPPKVNQETTYTVQLSVSNTVNTVASGVVTTTLPSYVSWKGVTNPSDGSVTYDDANHEVTWNVGEIPAGAGNGSPAEQMSFQIGLLPSVTQQGTSPILLYEAEFTGVDRFTQKPVTATAPQLTTQVTSDPGYKPAFGVIAK